MGTTAESMERIDREVADSATRHRAVPRWCYPIGLIAAVAIVQSIHGIRGPNFILDDWWILSEGVFDGVLGATDSQLAAARPGTVVAYGLSFGLFGNHPLPIWLELVALEVATVLFLFGALGRFLTPFRAFLTTLIWILLPNHMSLEIWPSTIVLAASLLCLAAAVWTVAIPGPSRSRQAMSLVLFLAASAFYEASIPIASALILVIPLLVERRLRWGYLAAGAATQGLMALWIVTHWHSAKDVSTEIADVGQVLPAHFGWGIAPWGLTADIVLLFAMAGICVAATRAVKGLAGGPERMMLAGLVIMIVGTLPFATYLYAPLGAGDRFNYVSAVGGALVWAGLFCLVGRWRVQAGVVALAALIAVSFVARLERAETWDVAGNDAVAILRAIHLKIPDPDGPIVVGPEPIQKMNVAAFLDHSNIGRALQVTYGTREVSGFMSFSAANFEEFPEHLRFDIRDVSELEADVSFGAR